MSRFLGKRTYQDSGFVPVVPAAKRRTITYARNGRTSGYVKPNSRYYSRGRGPYQNLSLGQRHMNPVYPPPEVKFWELDQAGNNPPTNPNNTSMPATGQIRVLNNIPQGTGSSARLGLKVMTKSCAYRFEIDLPRDPPITGAVPLPTSGRVMLIWDKQYNATSITYGTIFAQVSYLSYMNLGQVDRFTIIRNQQFSLSPNGDQSLFFEGFCKINMATVWASDGATVPTTGALLLVYISDQSATVSQPVINGTWRVRYLDN